MAILTSLNFPDAARLAAAYGLTLAELKPLAAGSVNSNFEMVMTTGQRFFGRIYEEQDRQGAERELRLLEELRRCALPVACAVIAGDGRTVLESAGKPFALYPWVEGELLCQGRVDKRAARAVGQALAQVHLASPQLTPVGAGRFGQQGIAKRLAEIRGSAAPHLAHVAGVLEQELERAVAERNPELPRGVIHGDLFRDNVLWGAQGITALLDFESASMGAFAYDLAVTLLAWCFGARLNLDLCQAMLEGYHACRPLSAAERSGVVSEGAIACLRFATTRITDFEMRAAPGQAPARDYRRFVARLEELRAGSLSAVLLALA